MDINSWVANRFGTDTDTLIKVLEMSPSSQGYIQGAVSELELMQYLINSGFQVWRIKEKPAGGFDEKKTGYKGDFLIKDNDGNYFVVECKGIKTNAEFRSAGTDENYAKNITKAQAINFLKKFINIDKEKIYNKGYKSYLRKKASWESNHPDKTYPSFRWTHENPGPDSVDLSTIFSSEQDIVNYVNSLDDYRFSEKAFRRREGAYIVMQTHKPSGRTDPETAERIAAPLVSDFSILAVDLFQRTGIHEFVFMNPDKISHSPEYPNHLYQNYIIDIIIPGLKDELNIVYPWYRDIKSCIRETSPRSVEFDISQLDHRETDDDEENE